MCRFGRIMAAVVVLGLGAAAVPSGADAAQLRVRKSVQALTPKERAQFVAAVKALKRAPSPLDRQISWYDQFVRWHVFLSQCNPSDPLMQHQIAGHASPMFLPWHREFLLLFEDALRAVSGKAVTVPYWDWTDPQSHASVFAADFMGGGGDPQQDYAVTEGPFRRGEWTVDLQPPGPAASPVPPYLQRKLGDFALMPTREEVETMLDLDRYDTGPWDDASDPAVSFRNALEGFRNTARTPLHGLQACAPDGTAASEGFVTSAPPLTGATHNIVHFLVGGTVSPGRFGTMNNVAVSPADPVFFLHHSMIDRVWAQWQERHGVNTYRSRRGGNESGDQMHPFEEVGVAAAPADVADIVALGYAYDAQPSGSRRRAATRSAGSREIVRAHARFRALCRIR